MAEYLVQTVGSTVASAACEARGRMDSVRWACGTAIPDVDELERLVVCNEVLGIVAESFGAGIARTWFIGSSCGDDGTMSPLMAIRVGNFDDARASARRFADGT